MMKCPRDRLLSLRVETFHSDEVLPEILLILGAEEVFPIDVELERASRRMTIQVRFDSLLMRPTAGLLRRLETLRAVQSADFFNQADQLIDVGWKRRAH
ncbi:hypothetical protein FHR22_002089 [Sphingopyxis panaciterrae]|nr:hypothetical protein [Sphingopyxis panaciterrae]